MMSVLWRKQLLYYVTKTTVFSFLFFRKVFSGTSALMILYFIVEYYILNKIEKISLTYFMYEGIKYLIFSVIFHLVQNTCILFSVF